jgi:hypothetical protein
MVMLSENEGDFLTSKAWHSGYPFRSYLFYVISNGGTAGRVHRFFRKQAKTGGSIIALSLLHIG